MTNKISFAMRLKKLREQKKLNQTELANLLEVSNGSISKWERGDRQPDYETLERIADIFNVTIDYLLGRSDAKYKSDDSQMSFSTPQEALSFILKQEMVADFGGYDLENMSDDEIMEMAEDEDIDFEENEDCEEYGRDYRFDEGEVEDAINFLFYYEECLPDDTDKAINDYRKYDDQLADAQSKLRHIEKKINMLVKDFNLENYRIETFRKSISTYLYIPYTQRNMEMVMNETDDADYYEDMDDEELEDLKELCIRFSDHDTGSYWDEEWGDVSYDDSYAKIEIN